MTPEKMLVICNIQAMYSYIDPDRDSLKLFYELEGRPIESLRELQDNLIPAYNKAIKS